MKPLILVPMDGSPAAESALPWAVDIARRTEGAVRLVGVHSPPAAILDGEALVGSAIPDDAIRDNERKYFADLEQRLAKAGVPVSADLIDGGVVASLAEYARTARPAYVVMMSHGRGPIARFFLGATAAEFVRESPCPVLMVHPTENPSIEAPPPVAHVIVPLDGSELAESILGPATAIAKLYHADLTLLMALAAVPDMEAVARRHEPGLPGPWQPEFAPAKANRYLEHLADRIRAQSIKVRIKVVERGDAVAVIAHEAGAGTLVALATHGRGGLAKLVWGSVADAVVRRTSAPVLVIRPPAA